VIIADDQNHQSEGSTIIWKEMSSKIRNSKMTEDSRIEDLRQWQSDRSTFAKFAFISKRKGRNPCRLKRAGPDLKKEMQSSVVVVRLLFLSSSSSYNWINYIVSSSLKKKGVKVLNLHVKYLSVHILNPNSLLLQAV
jgi:hypothetical protein